MAAQRCNYSIISECKKYLSRVSEANFLCLGFPKQFRSFSKFPKLRLTKHFRNIFKSFTRFSIPLSLVCEDFIYFHGFKDKSWYFSKVYKINPKMKKNNYIKHLVQN